MNEFDNFNQQEEEINLKELIFKYLVHWPWYLLSLIIFIILSFIYLKYQPNVYEANASVLVETKQNNPLADMSGAISGMFSQKDMIEDEIQIIKSLPILTETVKKNDLQTRLSYKTKFSKKIIDFYKDAPIEIEVFTSLDFFKPIELIFNQKKNNFNIEFTHNDSIISGQYNKRINLNDDVSIIIKPKKEKTNIKHLTNDIYININSIEGAAFNLLSELKIEAISKQSNAIGLSLKSTNLEKAKDILNELCNQYFLNSVEFKKSSLNNTGDFIKERIILLDDELKQIEREIKQYKQANQLTDFVTEAEIYSKNTEKINEKVFEAELQLNLVNTINNRIKKSNNDVIPVNQGFNDISINTSIAKYNEYVVSLKNLSENVTELNPERQSIEKQLREAKKGIIEGLANQKRILELTLNKVKSESAIVDNKVRNIPRIENEMRDIHRQHQTKEALFLYLLQKREEVAITITTLTPNAKSINYAHGSLIPVAPKKPIILLGFLIVAFLLPTAVIYIKDILDTKLHSIEQLEKISYLPNMGLIPNHHLPNRVLLEINDRSSTAEGLRLMLTNIEFELADIIGSKTILCTSTFAGEGKSFIAANIASYLAHSGKKTILLGFDLRAPKIDEFFDYDKTYGITHFVKKHEITIDDIIISLPDYDGKLDVVHSGIIVPNFVELLKNSRIKELFDYLKANYEYIIIDSAPVGLVSDTLNLAKYIDMALYVFRAHTFEKNAISISNKLYKDKKLKRMCSVLNGVDLSKKSYGYGYGYGKMYGYGYGDEENINEKYKFQPWRKEFWKYWIK
jgi:tyrosine-protein kinase Etk/Wzc